MFKKIIRFLGKLHIIRAGSYKVKGDMSKLIEADVSSKASSSGFYSNGEKKMEDKEKKFEQGEK